MPRMKREGSQKSPFLVRLFYFVPLALVLLERLWIPLRMYQSPSTSYFNLEKSKDHKRLGSNKIPLLVDITKSAGDWMKCPSKTRIVQNNLVAERQGKSSSRIPMTGESKCLSPALYKTFSAWTKLTGYETFFHDSISVHRLLSLDFPEFPLLRSILRRCTNTFEGKIGLWKYLVLYAYGGIFAPLGSSPKQEYFVGSKLTNEDAIFLIGHDGKSLLPNFMAVSPRHPMMYYAIHHYILGVLRATNISKVDNYGNIGLHAMNSAIEDFRRDAGMNATFGKTLQGTDGRTLTLLDHKDEDIDMFKSEGVHYVPGMLDFASARLPTTQHWEGSCVSKILSDPG